MISRLFSGKTKMTFSVHFSFLVLVFMCAFVKYATAQDRYCYSNDQDPYIQFSTKSAYELIRAKKLPTTVPFCKPVMTWASIRHGTRYPSRRTIEEMKRLVDVRDLIIRNHDVDKTGELCEKDLLNLKNYSYRLSPTFEHKLATQGKDDLRYMAKRLQAQFPQVLNTPYLPPRFAFFHDGTDRTIESANAFFDGLFGPDIHDAHRNSSLLMPADDCHAWAREVKNNSNTHKEYEAFKQSKLVHNMLAEINFRLGFRNNMSLDMDVIHLMYDTCRYEKAWYIGSRPAFCAAFQKDDLKILEYLEDLKYYYEYSYGNEMNKNLACPLLSDLVRRFNDTTEGNNKHETKPNGIFYFSHTALHIPLITLLKMKEDNEHLLHNNYEAMSKREFMSSMIDPFSANLVAALYECTTGEQFRVVFYLNEDIVHYPGCQGGLCPWSTVYEKLKPIVESSSCNFDFCNSASVNLASTPIILTTLIVCLLEFRKVFQF